MSMHCTCEIIEGPEDIVHQKCPLCKAAPELLEALKLVLETCAHDEGIECASCVAGYAALAKATGGVNANV